MDEVLKGLDYYAEHPDELPTDPDMLAKLAEMDTGIGDAPVSGKVVATEGVKQNDGTPPVEKDDIKMQNPQGIATKDGKHIIPYDVLAAERNRSTDLERQLQEQLAQNAELRKAVEGKATTQDGQKQIDVSNLTAEKLASIKEDFPEFAELLQAQNAMLSKVTQEVEVLRGREMQRQEIAVQDARTTAQACIDANPSLAFWQASNPVIFQQCVDLDGKLANDPSFKNVSMQDRFNKVAAAMENIYGKPVQTTAPPTPNTSETASTQQEKLDAILASRSAPSIRTLSDIPGGHGQESSEPERLANMTSAQVGGMLMNMSPDQMEAYLNSLG